jgi:cytochrome c6
VLAAFGVDRASAADVFAGQIVYQAHCANCHGPDGKPVLPGTPDLTRGEGLMAPDTVLVPAMKVGKGLMPGFEYILSEKDILNVLAYSRTLQR